MSDFDSSGEEYPAQVAHDSDFTNRGPLVGGNSYKRSRSDAEKLRRDLHYGQYLEIPSGKRTIFESQAQKKRRRSLVIAFAVIVVLLAVVVIWNVAH